MERVKVLLPQTFSFSTILPVRITDVNYGGHVGNNNFLSYAHEARLQFLKQFDYSELHFGSVGLIMADAAIEFKAEMKYGSAVKISVAAANFDRLGFDLFYLFETANTDHATVVAKIKTGMLCFDYAAGKLAPVPVEAVAKLQAAL